ncbi:MAG: lipid-A-disaccharide synthase [Pirellulales bacterium]
MRVFVSAGEPSGDHHAALLVRAIRLQQPEAECIGLGGPSMAAEGCNLIADMTQLAVMWFARALANIHRFIELARRAERSFLDDRPDICVMVDFPGFHWWLAWRAKRHGIPVVFYCPPQIWAWASWRKKKMRHLIDHVLSVLPFEHEWFIKQGISSTLVGHPFFDELKPNENPACESSEQPLVVLLPGSRRQEIDANFESIVRAASIVKSRMPEVQFIVGALHSRHAAHIQQKMTRIMNEIDKLNLVVEVGRTRHLINQAHAAIAVSGSVSLELLMARVPTVIVYRISSIAYVVQSWFRHARFITLVNLLACREPVGPVRPVLRPSFGVPKVDPEMTFPEYLVVGDPAKQLADHIIQWLSVPSLRKKIVRNLDMIADTVAHPGSADRAAMAVIAIANGRSPERALGQRLDQNTQAA